MWLALGVALCTGFAHAAEVDCITADQYQRVAKNYSDLTARFDQAAIAQEVLDLIAATQELKLRVKACQGHADAVDSCDPLQKQYSDMLAQRQALVDRLNLALSMQEYLATLKLKLERPRCEK